MCVLNKLFLQLLGVIGVLKQKNRSFAVLNVVFLRFCLLFLSPSKTLEDVVGCEISNFTSKYTSITSISDWSEGGPHLFFDISKDTIFSKIPQILGLFGLQLAVSKAKNYFFKKKKMARI